MTRSVDAPATDDTGADADGYAVLFDMDGVVLTGHGTDSVVYERALDDALADYGLTVADEHRSALAGHAYDDEFAAAARSVGVDPVGLFAVRESHSASRVVGRIESGTRGLYDDVGVLAALADRYDVGLVSNNYHRVVRTVVDHFDLDAFSFVRGRDTGVQGFERRKPDPHYLVQALDALGADRGLYVGDRETDVVAAERAGLDSVFVRRPHNAETSLSMAPTYEVDSLAELSVLATPE
jgi:phosphoglycolate phosphatase-like HAD superfamily hydrolase